MEVYELKDLQLILTADTYPSTIQLSANTIPINFFRGTGSVFSPNIINLNSDSISSGRRRLGMQVFVQETDTVYQYSIENVSSLACDLIAQDLCTYSKNGKIIHTNADIKLYPNPSTNSIVAINFEDVLAGEKLVDKSEISINISDLLGNIMRSYKSTQNNNIELNLTGLAKGVYMVTTQTNGKIYTKKLVLQ
jgi:hypothetical protein